MDKNKWIIVILCSIIGFLCGFTFNKYVKNSQPVEQPPQVYSVMVEAT